MVKKQTVKATQPDSENRKESPGNEKGNGPKTKLTFKEQQEYDRLEPEIEALETEKALLEEELNAGTLDYESLHQKSKRIAELIELTDTKFQRWMELGQYL